MSKVGVLAVTGIALVGGGVAVWALTRDEEPDGTDILDLPQPAGTECTTAEQVWESTQEVLANPEYKAPGLRKAADTLDTWGEYCDDDARNMAKTCSVLLRARADQLDQTPPSTAPPPITPGVDLPPSPIQLPGGHYYQGYGWCLPGAVLNLSTGLCEFTNPTIVQTSGRDCCGSCRNGGECEDGCS